MSRQPLHPALALALGTLFMMAGLAWFYNHRPVQPARPGIRAGLAQIALLRAAARYRVDGVLLLAIAHIETGGTFSASIRPRRKNGRFIGTARGLCQFIKTIARAYDLDWSTNSVVAQARACARLLNDNARNLQARLGRQPTGGELYLAHVFGAGKALKIITAKAENTVAATIGARALKANAFLARYKNAAGIRAWAKRKIAQAKKSVQVYLE